MRTTLFATLLAAASAWPDMTQAMARRPRDEKKEAPMEDAARLSAVDASPADWRGGFCSAASPSAEVVREAPAWERLWKRSLGRDAPPVDFTRFFAAAVFLGTRNTGGYSVEFVEPTLEDGKVVIGYRVRSPGPGGFSIQAFTQPYSIRLYRRTSLPVELRELPR